MKLTKDEKELILSFLNEERKSILKEEKSIIFEDPATLAIEGKYEHFLDNLIDKIQNE